MFLLAAVRAALRSRARQRDAGAPPKEPAQEVKVRERLPESEELYRLTLELSQQVVWTADADGAATMNARFYDLTGLPAGRRLREAIHPHDRGRLLQQWRESLTRATPHFSECRLRLRDGSYRTFRARAAPHRDAAGKVVRWYGTMEDIEEQKQAELARLEAEERYRLAARATSDAIWDIDLLADTIEWSGSESSFFGYPPEISPTSMAWWTERVHHEDRERVWSSFERALAGTAEHWAENYRFLCANEEWADVYDRGFIIRDEDGRAIRVVGAMSDFTERRRARSELQRMQAELVHVSRLSAMGAMASTLAHELNQPLTAVASYIRGGLRLLEKAYRSPSPDILSALESAEASALKAGQIVRGLRELVSRGIVTVKAEDLPRLIQEASVLAFIDEQAQGVTHKVELDPAARWVQADGIQVQQVLINLVRNAIEAMAGGPRREIVIATRPGADHMVEVSVADSGPGLSPEAREALFSPFRSRKAEGMGIGLSISRTIVEAHGGRIWADDGLVEGAVFRFTLPRAYSIPASPAEGRSAEA
jgi:two-component system sensor kinase FixL